MLEHSELRSSLIDWICLWSGLTVQHQLQSCMTATCLYSLCFGPKLPQSLRMLHCLRMWCPNTIYLGLLIVDDWLKFGMESSYLRCYLTFAPWPSPGLVWVTCRCWIYSHALYHLQRVHWGLHCLNLWQTRRMASICSLKLLFHPRHASKKLILVLACYRHSFSLSQPHKVIK